MFKFMFQKAAKTLPVGFGEGSCRPTFPRHLLRRLTTLTVLMYVVIFAQFPCTKTLQAESTSRPNIVLVMADDMGWGQTGYYNHPVLKTPNLDAMAEAGLRFDRFYAGAPVCSPTRASVLTGRSNRRTGVESHGFALRLQEKTIAQAMQKLGYATGHFGKWHLNGMRGPGVPILKEDTHNPGVFGFDMWLSVTNFFDRNPIMSRRGKFVEFEGDSSEIIVDEALTFIENTARSRKPSFTIIWYGTPHSPWMAGDEDKAPFAELKPDSTEHYGELVAMDRSIGTLRQGLRDLKIAENTVVWFCSDNGGLPKIQPETVGGLRGFKGSVYEGGLRVPAILEWPSVIKPRVTKFPAVTMDIAPTLIEITQAPANSLHQPSDGMSLKPLFTKELKTRDQPIPFDCLGKSALLDNNIKLIQLGSKQGNKTTYELYDLSQDPHEENNLFEEKPDLAEKMQGTMNKWKASLQQSLAGKDYPEGEVNPGEPVPQQWTELDVYRPYFDAWKSRPEYRSRLKSYNK